MANNYTSTHTGDQIEDILRKVDCIKCAVCSTASQSAAKVVSISGFPTDISKIIGAPISIKFENNVPANSTLKINDLSAKAIYYNNAQIAANIITAGQTVQLVYDGVNYNLIGAGANITIQNTQQNKLNVEVDNNVLKIY